MLTLFAIPTYHDGLEEETLASLNISLPDALKKFIEAEVKRGAYSTPSEYVRALVRAEQQRQLREQIDRNLLKAIDNGEATDMTQGDWEKIRQRVFAENSRRKK